MHPTGPFRSIRTLILASGSPRRKDLLGSTGIEFEIVPATAEEPTPDQGETPGGYALRMAAMKAQEIAARYPGIFILGCDTVVAVGEAILGKPRDEADARRMLALLSGRDHTVVTGCHLTGTDGETAWDAAVTTTVTMAPLTEAAIAAYVATQEPMDKAGAYAIQGMGGFMVAAINGSYSNVVGLPLAETVQALTQLGIIEVRKPLGARS